MANEKKVKLTGRFRYIADWLTDGNYLIIADEETKRVICDVWLSLTDAQLREARKLEKGAKIECLADDMEYPRYWKHCRSGTLVELNVIDNTFYDNFNPNLNEVI